MELGDIYVSDAHAFAAYLADSLPGKADKIFKDCESEKCEIQIPSIAMAELLFVFEKTSTQSKIWDMFDRLDLTPSLKVHALDLEILKLLPDIKLKEIHDRIIVATCKQAKAKGLITKDEEITRSGIVKTFW